MIYLVAGEPSGDLLGGRLIAALRELVPALDVAGIGGEAMADQGMASLFPQADLAVMGLAEVVPRIPRLRRRMAETVADILARRPAALVTIDSWGFNGRLLKRLRAAGFNAPCIHFVAPMVWAWKAKRVHDLVGKVDLLMCLLPNEPPLFEAAGVRSIHVGHPVLESGAEAGDGAGFRAAHGLAPDAPLVTILPGSRGSETRRLLPPFGETLARLAAGRPGLTAVVPTVATVADEVAATVASWPVPAIVVRGQSARYDAFAASRAALAASGTVALELAMAGLPGVIAYKVAALTAIIARRLIKLPFASLPNLLAAREVMPEFLQERCRPDLLAPALTRLMDDEAARADQRAGFAVALARLGQGRDSPSRRAAGAVLAMIEERR